MHRRRVGHTRRGGKPCRSSAVTTDVRQLAARIDLRELVD